MDADELVSVYSVKNASQAEVIRIGLENEGIACRVDGGTQASLTGMLDIQILVRAEDEARATAIIQEHLTTIEHRDDDEGDAAEEDYSE